MDEGNIEPNLRKAEQMKKHEELVEKMSKLGLEVSSLVISMARKKDDFWQYFEQLDRRFKCKFCGWDFSGGITRAKYHLFGVKGHHIEICKKVSADVKAKAYLTVRGSYKKGAAALVMRNHGISSVKQINMYTTKNLRLGTNLINGGTISSSGDKRATSIARQSISESRLRAVEAAVKKYGKIGSLIVPNASGKGNSVTP
ncbi:hypothetical protein Droror1_Dr00011522 [Drosera rotundifolia]